MMEGEAEEGPKTRAGYVALVGRPNAGKSTLLNTLIGEKLSIVTPREQTTREQVLGLLTLDGVQIVFVDTPGLLEPRYLLHRSMVEAALRAVQDSDIVLLLLDPMSDGPAVAGDEVVARLRARGSALMVAVNKVDVAAATAVAAAAEWTRATLDVEASRISAATGAGLDGLLAALTAALPESPFFYPEEDLAVQPVRFFVAELVRETIFEEYAQEVPYSSVVRIEEYRESEDPVYIRAVIYVERPSQKGIVIGKGGQAIKKLGTRARAKVEALIGRPVYLDLWVKPLAGWRKDARFLKRLGYHVPGEN